MVKKRVRKPKVGSSKKNRDLLMVFNKAMLFVVIALVIVAAITYFVITSGNVNNEISYSPAKKGSSLRMPTGESCSVYRWCIDSDTYAVRDKSCSSRSADCVIGQRCLEGRCVSDNCVKIGR